MGFLIGAFGKKIAGQRVRDLQNRMQSIQSQLRRTTREIGNMEKYINAQQRQMTNTMRTWSSMQMAGLQSANQMNLLGLQSSIFDNFSGKGIDQSEWTEAQKNEYNNLMSEYQMKATVMNNSMASAQQMLQTQMMQQQQQVENSVEMLKEMQLEPLKDLQDDLTQEKESCESELLLAENDYKACQEMEKAGAQNLVPRYTGQS